jgi:putative membrane protein
MKGISVAVLTLGLVALPVFAKRAVKETAKASMTDQQFLDFAAQTDMTEANLGQVAEDKGGQTVKNFGQVLRSDHTNDYQQLTEAAEKAGLIVPKGIDAEHDRMIASLDKLKGAAFDQRFARETVAGHEHALAVYKKEAADAQNPDIKAYAQDSLSTLQKHLDAAKQLEKPKG